MDAPVREKILAHLRVSRSASVAEMASSLSVTKADVRYHLNALINDRLVIPAPAGNPPPRRGRGRPAARFQLTGRASPENFRNLAAALLRLYLAKADVSSQESVAELARLMFPAMSISPSSLIQGLNQIVDELNHQEYDAHWEAHRDGPQIFFENCPYAAILPDFPQLCEMDRQILSRSSGMNVVQVQRIDSSRRQPPVCQFKLKKK